MSYMINQWRNSIGDIVDPEYGEWIKLAYPGWGYEKATDGYQYPEPNSFWLMAMTIIWLIWVVWFLNMTFNMIILLNFLIAIITQRYDEVMMLSQSSKYQQRSELVIETEVTMKYIKSYWKKDTDESPVVIMRSLEDSEVQADEW